jgi:hypothetical protein
VDARSSGEIEETKKEKGTALRPAVPLPLVSGRPLRGPGIALSTLECIPATIWQCGCRATSCTLIRTIRKVREPSLVLPDLGGPQ